MKLKGSQLIFNKLLLNNVKHVWLYSGGAIMGLIDCFNKQNKIQYFINTHEQNLGHSATGYARSTGKPGICIVTSGPGLTNMVTPMLDAQNDSCPLIVFSGNVSIKNMGTNAFQEAPSVDITKPFTKWSYSVKTINELDFVLDKAFNISMEGKKGVVHIDLPKCILAEEITCNLEKTKYKNSKNNINKKEIKTIANIINKSKKPVFYIGQGCNDYSYDLTKLVKKSNIPVTTTLHAVGCYDETDNLSLKFLGMHGSVYANKAIQESDCIIALGSRFDDRTTGNIDLYSPKSKKIHCNIDESTFNSVIKTDYNIKSDCGKFIKELDKHLVYKDRQSWFKKIDLWKNKYPFKYNEHNTIIYTQDVIKELNKQIKYKDNYIFTTGVGNHQMMTAQYYDFNTPKSLISSGSLGVMGFGLPASIGVAIGNPHKKVIDIDGDGSFLMTMSDMKTAVQYDLKNLKVIILNNKTLGMVDIWEKLFFNNRITATDNSGAPSFYEVAKTFGFKTFKCNNKNDLNKKISCLLYTEGPVLCEFIVEHTPCYPLVAPGKALDDMILWDTKKKIDNTLPPS
jgi:acetolactate synthase I/II/III large subunit